MIIAGCNQGLGFKALITAPCFGKTEEEEPKDLAEQIKLLPTYDALSGGMENETIGRGHGKSRKNLNL